MVAFSKLTLKFIIMKKFVGLQGLEPRITEPKSAVLPITP